MWEFMENYANAFWTFGKEAQEIIAVLYAWALTLIPIEMILFCLYMALWGLSEELKEKYRNHKKRRDSYGMEDLHQ